jgi:hypothetical protein
VTIEKLNTEITNQKASYGADVKQLVSVAKKKKGGLNLGLILFHPTGSKDPTINISARTNEKQL